MVDEHDRSTKLEDLNLEDWSLEDSFKPVSKFLDSLPSNSQGTESEKSIRIPSPSSVSLSKRSSLYETCVQIYQKQDHQLEALEQQMDEISAFLEQSTLRREKLLARALAQMQSINAEVQAHLKKCRYQCFKRRQIRTIDTANKRHGGGPKIFGHYNHWYC